MNPVRLENGHLLVPMRAEGPGGLVGDGMVEIGPDDPGFERWATYLAQLEAKTPEPRQTVEGGLGEAAANEEEAR